MIASYSYSRNKIGRLFMIVMFNNKIMMKIHHHSQLIRVSVMNLNFFLSVISKDSNYVSPANKKNKVILYLFISKMVNNCPIQQETVTFWGISHCQFCFSEYFILCFNSVRSLIQFSNSFGVLFSFSEEQEDLLNETPRISYYNPVSVLTNLLGMVD